MGKVDKIKLKILLEEEEVDEIILWYLTKKKKIRQIGT